MRSYVTHLASLAVLAGSAMADPTTEPKVTLTQGTGTTWNADWTSTWANRTFFALGSTDLVNWEFFPVVEFGTGAKITGFDNGGAPKYFFRLKYIDADWVTSEQEARDADFDGDGIPSWFEVEEIGSDPLDKNSAGGDENSNGLPDGWERFHFGALGIANPGDKLTPDNLTNKEKADLGLDPTVDYSSAATSQTAKYTYDLAGRLTGVTAPVATVVFTPDPEGNILNAQ